MHSNQVKSDVQASNHIVLRLARDSATTDQDDSWHVLSSSDHDGFCAFEQTVRTGKCKKVSRRKPKIVVTIRKPRNAAKRVNKERARKKKKIANCINASAILNSVAVCSSGGSNKARQKVSNQTDVLAADCCNFCGSSNGRKLGSVVRRSTTALKRKNNRALKENLLEDNIRNRITKTDISSVDMDRSERDMVSETNVSEKDSSHQQMDIHREGSVLNGMFGLAAEPVKKQKRRKVMPKSQSSKQRRCKVEETVKSETEVRTEVRETVAMTTVFECDKLNAGVGCGIITSRRSRPVKNRLKDNCYIYGQMVKTRRPRKTARKQPATETFIDPFVDTCSESFKVTDSLLPNVDDIADHAAVTDDDISKCHGLESSELSCTTNKSCVHTAENVQHGSDSNSHVLGPSDHVTEGESGIDVCENVGLSTENLSIELDVLNGTQIPFGENAAKITNSKEIATVTVDDCKNDIILSCDTVADTCGLTEESTSPSLDCIQSYIGCGSVDNGQLSHPSPENSCLEFVDDLSKTMVDIDSAETLDIKPAPSTELNSSACGADSGREAVDVQHNDTEMCDLFQIYSDELNCCTLELSENDAISVDSHLLVADANFADPDVFRTGSEPDRLLAEIVGDVEFDMGSLEHTASEDVVTNLVSANCDAIVEDDTGMTALCNDVVDSSDIPFLSELSFAGVGEIVETFMPDEYGIVADETNAYSTDTKLVTDVGQGMSANEGCGGISDALPTSDVCIIPGDYHGVSCAEDIAATQTSSEVVCLSILPAVDISANSKEFDLSVKETLTEHHHQYNTRRSHKARRKTLSETAGTDFSYNSTEFSSDLLNMMVSGTERSEELTVGTDGSIIATDPHGHDQCPVVSNVTSSGSSLSAKVKVAGHRRRPNTHQSHRARRKTVCETDGRDLIYNPSQFSADLLNMTVSGTERSEELTIGNNDSIIATDHVINQSVQCPVMSNDTLGSSLPAKVKVAGRRRRPNTQQSRRARRKTVCETVRRDFNYNPSQFSADLLNVTVSGAERSEELTIGNNDSVIATDPHGHVQFPVMSNDTSLGSSLPAKVKVAGRRRRPNTHQSCRAHRKTVSETGGRDLSDNSAEFSADLFSTAVSGNERSEELTIGNDDSISATDSHCHVLNKSSQLPLVMPNDTSSGSSLSTELPKGKVAGRRCGANTYRSHRARRKTVSGTLGRHLNYNPAEFSADLLNTTISGNERSEELTVGNDDSIIATDLHGHVQFPVMSNDASLGSNLPAKVKVAGRRRRPNTHQSHQVRRKTVFETDGRDLNYNSAEFSADLLNVTVSGNEKSEELTIDDSIIATDHVINQSVQCPVMSNDTSSGSSLPANGKVAGRHRRTNTHRSHRARRKTVSGNVEDKSPADDSVEVIQNSDVETDSAASERKRHHDPDSRLFYRLFCYLLLLLTLMVY